MWHNGSHGNRGTGSNGARQEGEREREGRVFVGGGEERWRDGEGKGIREERELCLRLRDSISIICRFVDSELCDYAPPPPPTSSSSSTVFCLPPIPSRPPDPTSLLPPTFSSAATHSPLRVFLRVYVHGYPRCVCTHAYTHVEAIYTHEYIYIYVDAKRSLVTAPEPSIRLFA